MIRKLTASLLITAMLFTLFTAAAEAADAGTDFIISNPYEQVDWDSWSFYKAQLHCHSNVSDGNVPLNEVVKAHYALDFDILAVTDHAVVGKPWNVAPETVPLFRLVKYDRTKMAEITPLTDSEFEDITTGVGRDGRGMLCVDRGIELNGAVPSNSHLNGFFSDYGQSLLGVDGDYETPVAGVEKAGGITFLDHLGYYTKTKIDNNPAASDDPDKIMKFANIFLKYPSCVGMDINSSTDTHTKYDRVLYDNILKTTVPYGVTPWCFTFSDAHEQGQWDRAFTVQLMTELTNTDLRRSMTEGTFFAISRSARYELGDEFYGEGAYPIVNEIEVNEQEDIITLSGENYDNITWVSDGKTVATGESVSLRELDNPGCYIRAYLTGPGGICYVQPFALSVEGEETAKPELYEIYDYSSFLRELVTFLDDLIFRYSSIIAAFKFIALGVKPAN